MLKKDSFVNKKFGKLYLAALLGWLVCIVGEMADTVLAGILLSEEAVSAVELVTPLGSLIYALGLPVAYGSAMVYSRNAGAFELDKAYKTAFQGAVTSVAAGIIMALALLLGKNAYLDFYGASDTIRELASEYYNAYIVIALIEPVFWNIYNLVLVDGDEGLSLAMDIAMAVINAVVSLILGKKIGIRGLAIGTLASYVLTFGALFIHFGKKSNSIRFRRAFKIREIGAMAYVGSSSAMTNIYLAIIDIVMNRFIIARFGDIYLPAYAVVNTVLNLAGVLLCAFDGSRPFVTVGMGEENYYSVRRVMRISFRYAVIAALIMTVAFEFLATRWGGIYGITSPEVLEASAYAGRIIPFSYLAVSFTLVLECYYPCIGEVLLGNVLGMGYMLAGPLVLAIPLSFVGGFNGMTVGFMLTPIFALLLALAVVAVTKRVKDLPYLLPHTDETAAAFDLYLSSESISMLCAKVRDTLTEQEVEPAISNQVQLVLEETLMTVVQKNPGKKVMADATVLVSGERVRLITRDNGVIFDITDDNAEIRDLRCYVLSQLLLKADEKSYSTSISFNRNMYIWERTEGKASL